MGKRGLCCRVGTVLPTPTDTYDAEYLSEIDVFFVGSRHELDPPTFEEIENVVDFVEKGGLVVLMMDEEHREDSLYRELGFAPAQRAGRQGLGNSKRV